MKRTKTVESAGDLFSAAAGAETPEPTALIASPLVTETAGWLEARARTLGNLLASERAVEYVAILRAFVRFREGHEPEPLHEDLSSWPEEDVPYDWLRGLLATAAMRGDAQIRPDGERSRPPLPKLAERTKRSRIVTWITPRKVGAKADVASIEQARGERLGIWMRKVCVFPESGKSVRLGGGRFATFADCSGIVDVIVATRLGGGRTARRHLEVVGTPCLKTSRVSLSEGELVFQDLELTETGQAEFSAVPTECVVRRRDACSVLVRNMPLVSMK